MELRGYFFGNMYLSAIQQGIQAKHCGDEMTVKYLDPNEHIDPAGHMLFEYLRDYKTVILLNAGYSDELHDINKFFGSPQNPYPYASFSESKEALDGAMTCAGIILPAKIFTAAEMIRLKALDPNDIRHQGDVCIWTDSSKASLTDPLPVNLFEFELINRLNNYGLAR